MSNGGRLFIYSLEFLYHNNPPIRGNKRENNVFPTTAPPSRGPPGRRRETGRGEHVKKKLARTTEKNPETVNPGGTKPRAGEYERNGYFTALFGPKETPRKIMK